MSGNKRLPFITLALLLVAAAAVSWHKFAIPASLVPKEIRSSVKFSVYYPNPKKLPSGYVLDTKSFRMAEPGVALFAVTYGGAKEIVFSEEQQPAGDVVDKFDSAYIPLHTTLSTRAGHAQVGAYGSGAHLQTLASLPINKGPWLIITAPASLKTDDLKTILNALGTN